MSCSKCAVQAAPALELVGVSSAQLNAVWGHPGEHLPHCGRCGRFMSPRNMVCNGENCARKGEQQGDPMVWPPPWVKFTSDTSKSGQAVTDPEALRALQEREAERNIPPLGETVSPEEAAQIILSGGAVVDDDGAVSPEAAAYSILSGAADVVEDEAFDPNEGDYVITDADNLGEGGAKTKCKNNVAAIRLLKQLEEEGRPPTPEEQAVLVKYSGWGGIPQVFDSKHAGDWRETEWTREYKALKALLTDEEWESARASTPNAHYTSPEVIEAMWDGLERLGFEGGTVLEPAAGIGHFFGLMPEEMRRNSQRFAVELDDVSARITQQLYPNADVHSCGYQEAPLPNEYFDLVVSNVPFGNYPVYDPEFDKPGRRQLAGSIHNYYFGKALDQVKPGGVVAFITSRYTMDAQNPAVRRYLASQADLLGAVRLPNTAFKQMAGTDVTTDVIFLRKRAPGDEPADVEWTETEPVEMERINSSGKKHWQGPAEFPMNQYFVDHPEMMLGDRMEASGTMYGRYQPQLVSDGGDLSEGLAGAMQRLPEGVMKRQSAKCPRCGRFMNADGVCVNCPSRETFKMFTPDMRLKDGAYTVQDGAVYQREGSTLVLQDEMDEEEQARIEGLVAVRDVAKEVLHLNATGASDEELAAGRAELNRIYDEFVGQYGPITARENRKLFEKDPEAPFLLALEEDYDPEAETAGKADIFEKRTIRLQVSPDHADTSKDALLISLNELGMVDVERMAELTGFTEAQVIQDLEGEIFRLPGGGWETRDAYLSGDVKSKLREAERAARIDPVFQVNAEALRAVIPPDLMPSDISAGLGSGWIPPDVITDFTEALFGERQRLEASYSPTLAEWALRPEPGRYWFNKNAASIREWSTARASGIDLLINALNGRTSRFTDPDPSDPDGKRRIVNQAETDAAREMQEKIKARFDEWVWSDPERARRLTRIYNDKFNRTILREWDGSHLTLPGIGADVPELRPHQKDVIWRIVQSGGTTLMGHVVGAGKTYAMIGAAMEMKRLGMRNKSSFVIPNHMLEQFGGDVQQMYPNSKVLLVGGKDVSAKKRQETMARVATGDWDAVIFTHSAWGKLKVRPETEASFIQQEISLLDEEIQFHKAHSDSSSRRRRGDRARQRTVKQLEKKKKRLEAKLKRLASRHSKDDVLYFEDLGVDQVFVDEAHAFKNLGFYTRRDRVAGLNQQGSKRAFDMFMKTQYLQRRCGECGRFVDQSGVCTNCLGKTSIAKGGVVFATGTPIANSVAEMYTMMRFLQKDRLEALGLAHFDAWANQFGKVVSSLEMKPSGDGYRRIERFARFDNIPDLLRLFGEVADLQMDAKKLGLDLPNVKGGEPGVVSADPSNWLKEFIQDCAWRADHLPNDPSEDNMLKIVYDARIAALDRRLVDPSLPDDPNSKVNLAVENIVDIYRETTGIEAEGMDGPQNMAQVVFLDMSTPKGNRKAADYEKLARLQRGGTIPSGVWGDTFNVYDDIKAKLMAQGIPEDQIAFIHDAKNDEEKQEIFDRVNAGEIRVILGSTQKMGSGTNIQERLVAQHDIDLPWRPADLEQRKGRIERPGNVNDEIGIYRYVTEGSFDVFMAQTLETKAKFIAMVMSGEMKQRSMEDIRMDTIGYAQLMAVSTGDNVFIEKVDVETRLNKLRRLHRAHQDRAMQIKWDLERKKTALKGARQSVEALEAALQTLADKPEAFTATFGGQRFGTQDKRVDAGEAFMRAVRKTAIPIAKSRSLREEQVGTIRGCPVIVKGRGSKDPAILVRIRQGVDVEIDPSRSPSGNMRKLMNAVDSVPDRLQETREQISRLQEDIEGLERVAGQPFEHVEELEQMRNRYKELVAYTAKLEREGEQKIQEAQAAAIED